MGSMNTTPTPPAPRTDRRGLLVDQLLDAVGAARRRLEGLSDAEFVWEPTATNWSIRPRAATVTPDAFGPGEFVLDLDRSFPVFAPAPLSTIAWRVGHLCSLYAGRWEYTFGDASADPHDLVDFDRHASIMLERLWTDTDRWINDVERLDDDELDTVGLSAYPLGLDLELPFVAVLRWQNSETIHHLAEIALLRDLYAQRAHSTTNPPSAGH